MYTLQLIYDTAKSKLTYQSVQTYIMEQDFIWQIVKYTHS